MIKLTRAYAEAAQCIAANQKEKPLGVAFLSEPRAVTDTAFDKPFACWLVWEAPACAIVFYNDNPKSAVSTGNHPGRFVERVS